MFSFRCSNRKGHVFQKKKEIEAICQTKARHGEKKGEIFMRARRSTKSPSRSCMPDFDYFAHWTINKEKDIATKKGIREREKKKDRNHLLVNLQWCLQLSDDVEWSCACIIIVFMDVVMKKDGGHEKDCARPAVSRNWLPVSENKGVSWEGEIDFAGNAVTASCMDVGTLLEGSSQAEFDSNRPAANRPGPSGRCQVMGWYPGSYWLRAGLHFR